MPKSRGIFLKEDIDTNLERLKAPDPVKVPLPETIKYLIPKALATKLKDKREQLKEKKAQLKHQAPNLGTLSEPTLAKVLYMDVGRWGGDGPSYQSSGEHWGRRRDFGIVCGRLAALCTYKPDAKDSKEWLGYDPDTKKIDDKTASLGMTDEFKQVLPLLRHLSEDPKLGRVAVTKALLGDPTLAVAPKPDVIYVFLGDLHAPVMTERRRTYSGVAPQAGNSVVASSSGQSGASQAIAVTRSESRHPMNGRYEPSGFHQVSISNLVDFLAYAVRMVNEKGHAPLKGVMGLVNYDPDSLDVLQTIWNETALPTWHDPSEGSLSAVEDWFDRYHGSGDRKGADIFENAGVDLKIWLELLLSYQSGDRGGGPGIRLAQLGDLFDFWIGLKCAFGEPKLENRWDPSAWSPTEAAIPFAEYWKKQTLEHADDSGALKLLVHFDDQLPVGKKANPVFLYGNHDNYLGVAGMKHTLKAQFNEDPGLVAQHGHQVDGFNSDENARLGYIITQACFVTHEARGLENPMSALIAEKSSKNGPRLDATQMALEECVFRPLLKKDTSPAMTFVMGHTHEPLLQEIVVLQRPEKNPAKSEPPEYSPLPLNRLLQKVKVTARFIQVDFVDDSYSDIPGFCMNWHLREVRTIPLVEPLVPKKGGILIYDQTARAGQSVPAQAGAGGTLTISACEELEVQVETSNGHVVSQRVAVKGWEGIHTIEYAQPSGKGRYTVTFELVWGEFVD